jgi:hypothetical protein
MLIWRCLVSSQRQVLLPVHHCLWDALFEGRQGSGLLLGLARTVYARIRPLCTVALWSCQGNAGHRHGRAVGTPCVCVRVCANSPGVCFVLTQHLSPRTVHPFVQLVLLWAVSAWVCALAAVPCMSFCYWWIGVLAGVCETVPGTGEVARFPAETLGTHKDGNTEHTAGVCAVAEGCTISAVVVVSCIMCILPSVRACWRTTTCRTCFVSGCMHHPCHRWC